MPPGPVRRFSTDFFSVVVVRRVVRLVVVVRPSVLVLFVSVTVVRVDELDDGAVPGPSSRVAVVVGATSSGAAALSDGTATGSGGKLDMSAAAALCTAKGTAFASLL